MSDRRSSQPSILHVTREQLAKSEATDFRKYVEMSAFIGSDIPSLRTVRLPCSFQGVQSKIVSSIISTLSPYDKMYLQN